MANVSLGSGVSVDCEKLLKRLEKVEDKSMLYIKMKANLGAKEMENYAKMYRPWTDRTGNARRTLHGYIEDKGGFIRIYISHGMSYGVSLEFDHGQKYAICLPTVNACASKIMGMFKDIVKVW